MSFNPDNGKIAKVDNVTPVEKINELAELNWEDIDLQEIEEKASIFVRDAKFTPIDGVKLVSVEQNGKIIYEDDGKMQLVESQYDLAQMKTDGTLPTSSGLFGFFGKSKAFGRKDDDRLI